MTKKYLIDTDIFIDYLMGEGHAREFFEQLPEGSFYYSAISKVELLSSAVCSDSAVRGITAGLLSLGKKIEMDEGILAAAAELKREHSVSIADSIKAASALHAGAELVTKNVGDFKKIKGLTMIKPY